MESPAFSQILRFQSAPSGSLLVKQERTENHWKTLPVSLGFFTAVTLSVLLDDGAVVYLNGTNDYLKGRWPPGSRLESKSKGALKMHGLERSRIRRAKVLQTCYACRVAMPSVNTRLPVRHERSFSNPANAPS